jgi:hypothetical protein
MFTKISSHIFAKELKSTFPLQSFFAKWHILSATWETKGLFKICLSHGVTEFWRFYRFPKNFRKNLSVPESFRAYSTRQEQMCEKVRRNFHVTLSFAKIGSGDCIENKLVEKPFSTMKFRQNSHFRCNPTLED